MKTTSMLALLIATLVSIPGAHAETWRTSFGDKCEGALSGVYGPFAMIAGEGRTTKLPLEQMDDVGLARVADFLAARTARPDRWSGSDSKVAKSLKNQLQVLREGKLIKFETGDRPEPEVYLVYFGAQWCGPCRAFSPDLVTAYRKLKAMAPDYFELVFVSSDREPSEQLSYARAVGMPWPVVKFGSLGRVQPLERWAGNGIPCLVAVTRDGDMIYHSYVGAEYVGPQAVLKQFEELLRSTQGESDTVKRARHRLAVLQHTRAAGASGAARVKPYVIEFNPSKYRTLTIKEFVATLVVDEKGRVTAAQFEPAFPAALDYQVNEDVRTWLFLPAVENGRPKSLKIAMPVKL
ncbi:MAG: thioredoxin-like domain-containing protein [Verrucomicrobia bacterium]|nr:thioredoxin-like domain-containing protein [Verrucomicrobiota bacterium]